MDTLRRRTRALRNAPTDAEAALWRLLRRRELLGCRFRRQVPLHGYIADFVRPSARLVIELDGGQHAAAAAYDARRDALLATHGYRVQRYWNDQVLKEPDAVLEDLLRALAPKSDPSPTLPFACGEREGEDSPR